MRGVLGFDEQIPFLGADSEDGLTIVIGTDVQASRLARGNSLMNTEHSRCERANTLVLEDCTGSQAGTGARDLETEPVFRDADACEFAAICACVLQGLLGVVGV